MDCDIISHVFLEISQFFVMLVLLFCKLSEQCSQTNFPIKKPFKLTKKGEKRMADIYNHNNLLHLYSAFLGTQTALQRRGNLYNHHQCAAST